jgi:transposase-like protein
MTMAAGKKPLYSSDMLPIIEGLCRNGYTNKEIALKIGIAEGTIYEWIKKYPELAEVLKRTKEIVDLDVEKALLSRALGYTVTETETTTTQNNIKVKTITKHIAPDVTACIFWLKNRQPDNWRDKQVVETENKAMEKLLQEHAQALTDTWKERGVVADDKPAN